MAENRLVTLSKVFGRIATWMPTIGLQALFSNVALVLSELAAIYTGINVKSYGATGNGQTDDTSAILAAIAAAVAGSFILFPNGSYVVRATLQILLKAITFRGTGYTACQLSFHGNNMACIQLGTDDGNPWDAAEYNGPAQGFAIQYMALSCANTGAAGETLTPLTNTITNASYGTGTYAVRDFRCGSVRFERVAFSHWQYGFWGVQSDINYFNDIIPSYNSVAFYHGARSDQAMFKHIWSGGNDSVFVGEGVHNHSIEQWISDTDGSGTIAPCIIRNSSPTRNARYSTTRSSGSFNFKDCWFEQLGSFGVVNPGYDVDSIVEVGIGDAVQNGTVKFDLPHVLTNRWTLAGPHFLHLVNADNCTGIKIEDVSGVAGGVPWNNCRSLIKITTAGASPPQVWFSDLDGAYGSCIIENYSAATVVVQAKTNGFGNSYTYNVSGGTGTVFMGAYGFHRVFSHNNTPPSSGIGGDVILNRLFSFGKSLGWAYTGSSAIVLHAPTLGGDRGNISVTLTPETDHEEQTFATALTADRDCVLAAPPNPAIGYYFYVTRSAGGAFNLNVKNLTGAGTVLKAIPANAWGKFMWDGTNWQLRESGSL